MSRLQKSRLCFLGMVCVMVPIAWRWIVADEQQAPRPALRKSYLVRPKSFDAALRDRLVAASASAIVLELTEEDSTHDFRKAADLARESKLPVYGWIEIGRSATLATQHPDWLAALGMHDDWRKRFPDFPRTAPNEVIKAWPWVTIWYQEAYAAHLERVRKLLSNAPRDLAGVYLNDIQGAPSSCGCGNDQCRWTQDYHIQSTATKLAVPETPARFIADVKKILPGKPVIPVWCIECEELDQDYSRPTTGFCGGVGCYKGLCWKEYFKQLPPVLKATGGQIAVATFSRELRRDRKEYHDQGGWITAALGTFQTQAKRHSVESLGNASLIPVLQGWDDKPDQLARELQQAEIAGCRDAIVSLIKIDQSWRPMAHVVFEKP